MNRFRLPAQAVFAAAVVLSSPAAGEVVLRDADSLSGRATVSPAGVRAAGGMRMYRLDEVRTVTGASSERWAELAETADRLWRGRTRLARGDLALGCPIFAELADDYLTHDPDLDLSPTADLVAAGALRCGIEQGDHGLAMRAFMHARSNASRIDELAGQLGAPDLIDPVTGLCPRLAPIFLADQQRRVVVETLAAFDHPIARLYRRAAGETDIPRSIAPSDDDLGQALVEAIADVDATSQASEDALERLRGIIARQRGTWQEAWARAARGLSFIRSDDLDQRTEGILELAHLPARFSGELPELAHAARALIARELTDRGEIHPAAMLREQMRGDPLADHALEWLDEQLARPVEEAALHTRPTPLATTGDTHP